MVGVEISALPTLPKTIIGPMITGSPQPEPYTELHGVRLRRLSPTSKALFRVALETTTTDGEQWLHWIVCRDPDSTYGLVGLGPSMSIANVLAAKAPKSEAARLVEQTAPRAAALSRYAATSVAGVEVAALNMLNMEEKYVTVLLVPLPEMGHFIDEPWLRITQVVLDAGWEVVVETYALEESFSALPVEQRLRLVDSPTTNWADMLKRAGQVSQDVTKILRMANAAGELLAGG